MTLSNYIILLVIAVSRNLSTNQTHDTLIQVLSYIDIIMPQENNVSLYTKEVFHNRVKNTRKFSCFLRKNTQTRKVWLYLRAIEYLWWDWSGESITISKIKLNNETKLKRQNQLFQPRLQLKLKQNKKAVKHGFSN